MRPVMWRLAASASSMYLDFTPEKGNQQVLVPLQYNVFILIITDGFHKVHLSIEWSLLIERHFTATLFESRTISKYTAVDKKVKFKNFLEKPMFSLSTVQVSLYNSPVQRCCYFHPQ